MMLAVGDDISCFASVCSMVAMKQVGDLWGCYWADVAERESFNTLIYEHASSNPASV